MNTGTDESAAIGRAQAAIARLADKFLLWMDGALAECDGSLAAAEGGVADNRPQMHEIFAIAHNIKGQAGTFGYNLQTAIAASLCVVVRSPTHSFDAHECAVVRVHLQAMRIVHEGRVTGDGGEVGEQIRSRLAGLLDAAQAR